MDDIKSIITWNELIAKDYQKLYREIMIGKGDLAKISEYGENIRGDAESALNEIPPTDEVSIEFREILKYLIYAGCAYSIGDILSASNWMDIIYNKYADFYGYTCE